MAKNLQENIISSANQNRKDIFVHGNEGLKIMFVGNSITKHAPLPEKNWLNDCGMAASSLENDYVHLVVKKIRDRYDGKVSFCIVQVANFERTFEEADISRLYGEIKNYAPDIMIMFFGANVPRDYDEKTDPKVTFGEQYENLRNFLACENTTVIHSEGFYIREKLDAEKKAVAEKYGDVFVNIENIRNREETHGMFNHPNDLGMKEIADAFCEAINKRTGI